MDHVTDQGRSKFLGGCSKDQLLKVAENYDIDLSGLNDKHSGNVKALVKVQLIGKGVLVVKQGQSGESQAAQSFRVPSGNLTFEQQKELLCYSSLMRRTNKRWRWKGKRQSLRSKLQLNACGVRQSRQR